MRFCLPILLLTAASLAAAPAVPPREPPGPPPRDIDGPWLGCYFFERTGDLLHVRRDDFEEEADGWIAGCDVVLFWHPPESTECLGISLLRFEGETMRGFFCPIVYDRLLADPWPVIMWRP